MEKKSLWAAVALALVAALAYLLYPRGIAVEYGKPVQQTVRAFIAEDGETQLAELHLIDMPVSGKLESLPWEIGDDVEQGALLARVEADSLREQVRGMDALIEQVRAQMTGVDVQKPKAEALASARLQVKEAEAAVEMARRAVAAASIQYEETRKQFERISQLFARGVVSQREHDQAKAAAEALEQDVARARLAEERARKGLEIARLGADLLEGSVDDNEFMRDAYLAQIENLEAQRNVIQRELERTAVIAPVSGPVLMKFVEAGRMPMAGTPLLQLGDLASSEIIVDVLSEEVVRIPGDALVEITGKALGGRTLTGRVKRIYPAAYKRISALGIEQQRVRILVDYDVAAAPLRPGTSLDVKIITATREDAVAVPERALFEKGGQYYVFRVRRNRAGPLGYDHAELVPVTVNIKNDEWAAIEDGLSLGDTIIVEPTNELDDGTWVQPKN